MFKAGESIAGAVEPFTGAMASISTDHAYIHKGIAFRLSGKTASIAAGAKTNIAITTPAASVAYIHMRPELLSSSENLLEVRMTEGETVSAGSTLTPQNQNRNSSATSGVVAKLGVTVTVAGTNLGTFMLGTGGAASVPRSGGGSGQDNELLLKPATTYVFEFENIGSTTATVAYYNLFWYEEKRGI